MVNVSDVRTIERARLAVDALRRQSSKDWLKIAYRRSLYGGWAREDESLAPPHRKAIKFHEASKALFCCACGEYLAQIGSDLEETWDCSNCGENNRLPPKDDEPGDWLLSGPSFSKHFPLTLNPYFEQAMASRIVDKVKNQQKVVTMYTLDNGDKVHCLSYEQYLKAGRDATNPFEGPRWKGALFDEPPPREVWVATKRGLLRWQSKYSKPPFAQVYDTIFIGGGNQSLEFSSRVWDHGEGCHVKIGEIRDPLTVLGWDGEQLVPTTAYPYPAKPAQPLFRVRLRSGHSFRATAGHRVLSAQGRWRHLRDLVPGDSLAVPDPRQFHQIHEPTLLDSDATTYARTDLGRPIGSGGGHRSGPCLRDGQQRPDLAGTPASSVVPVQAWTRSTSFRPDMRSDPCRAGILSSQSGFHASCTGGIPVGLSSRVAALPTHGSDLRPRPTRGSGLPATLDSPSRPPRSSSSECSRLTGSCPTQPRSQSGFFLQKQDSEVDLAWPGPLPASASVPRSSFTTSDELVYDEILSIEEMSSEVNYDLWVPGCESFLAEGVIHHNSSKSYTSRAEFCARIVGERPWDGSLSMHYGRAIFAATPLASPWMFHEVYQNAWNKGGSNRSIFAIEFDITDNPALTEKAIENFSEGLSPEEREARLHGRFKHLSGRIFSEFDQEVHVYDPETFDPLTDGYGKGDGASALPVIMSVDPHPRKPWFILWVAIGPDGKKYAVDEWPNEDFHRMKYSTLGLDDYAATIRDKEACMPDGEMRVLWREFDPNMSRTPKTVAEGSTTLVDEMRDRGLYFESDVNDKIDFGHSVIHTLLGWDEGQPLTQLNRPSLYISKKCQNLIFAFENYIWDDRNATDPERAGPVKPKDIGKDPIDTLRYCLVREQDYMDWRDATGGFDGHFNQAQSDLENW